MVKRRAASAADVPIAFEKSAYAAVAARTPVSFFRKFRCCPIRCFAREKRSARFFRLDCLGIVLILFSLVKPPKLRFPRHWSVHRKGAGLSSSVMCEKGVPVAYVPCRNDLQGVRFAHNHLTSDEARRIANGASVDLNQFGRRPPGK